MPAWKWLPRFSPNTPKIGARGTGQIRPCELGGEESPLSSSSLSSSSLSSSSSSSSPLARATTSVWGLGVEYWEELPSSTMRPLTARAGTLTSTLSRPTPLGLTRRSSRAPARPVKITVRTPETLRPRILSTPVGRTLTARDAREAEAPQRERQVRPTITGRALPCAPVPP